MTMGLQVLKNFILRKNIVMSLENLEETKKSTIIALKVLVKIFEENCR